MSWPKALATWLLIVVAESILEIIRQLFIRPLIGDLLARQVGVLFGSVITFAIACTCIRWIGARLFAEQLKVGLVWVVLIAIFKLSLGMPPGFSPERVLPVYGMSEAGFMGLGLLFMLFAPALAAKARGFVPQPSMSIGQKLLIGVLLPVLLCAVAGFIAMLWWPRASFGPGGQLLSALALVIYGIPTTALLNLWVLPIEWKKDHHCFLAGMCAPTVTVVLAFVYYHTFHWS